MFLIFFCKFLILIFILPKPFWLWVSKGITILLIASSISSAKFEAFYHLVDKSALSSFHPYFFLWVVQYKC
ncbi:hypothetical protein QVD17_25700 [Tagetes erecta]|uniref:Uncharacterized protein n=1 Tax=Tagetes erecta TaxID=13708 RepID=A0AAD8NVK7_TARER|nr:hypothetical protein QVD17_25700 [Tagetes erecta]